jgi:hypothetical protein
MLTATPFLHQNMEEYVNIPDLLFIIRLTDNKRHHNFFFTSVERMFVPQVPLLKGLSRPSENRSELLFYESILKKAGAAGYEPSVFKT